MIRLVLLVQLCLGLSSFATGEEVRAKSDTGLVKARCQYEPPKVASSTYLRSVLFEIQTSGSEWRPICRDFYSGLQRNVASVRPLVVVRGESAVLCVARKVDVVFMDIDLRSQKLPVETGLCYTEASAGDAIVPKRENVKEILGSRIQFEARHQILLRRGSPVPLTVSMLDSLDREYRFVPKDVRWLEPGGIECEVFSGSGNVTVNPNCLIRYFRPSPEAKWQVSFREVKNVDDPGESPWIPLQIEDVEEHEK